MGTLAIEVVPLPGGKLLQDEMEQESKRASDLMPAMEMIALSFKDIEKHKFESEGPGWKGLAQATLEGWGPYPGKNDLYPGALILERTDALGESFYGDSAEVVVTNDFFESRSSVAYAGFHQHGTSQMVARPPVDLMFPPALPIWTAILQSYIFEGDVGAGLTDAALSGA